ncbi:MAG TPA: FAD binding domain-containing protein [Beijerinckiaceae bacterium]|nr:FAD binding domain-containing protein [Beijerinckiaceae bacterium]
MTAYFRPVTLEEALAIRAGREVEIIAGGTDVYPNKTTRAGWGRMAHKDVLDVTAVPGLRGIEEVDGHWRIGALVTWTDVIRAGLPRLFDGLVAAAREIGGQQIQNRATLVGNLCTASPAGDGIPNLLAIEAEVEIASLRGTRIEPLESFLDGYRHTTCGADEIVTALRIPKRSAEARSAFLKLGARRYLVISIAMAAAVVDVDPTGVIGHARLVVGACSPVARRLRALEERLLGHPLTPALSALVQGDDLAELAPLDDARASAAYRLAAAETLIRDLLAGFGAARERRAA